MKTLSTPLNGILHPDHFIVETMTIKVRSQQVLSVYHKSTGSVIPVSSTGYNLCWEDGTICLECNFPNHGPTDPEGPTHNKIRECAIVDNLFDIRVHCENLNDVVDIKDVQISTVNCVESGGSEIQLYMTFEFPPVEFDI